MKVPNWTPPSPLTLCIMYHACILILGYYKWLSSCMYLHSVLPTFPISSYPDPSLLHLSLSYICSLLQPSSSQAATQTHFISIVCIFPNFWPLSSFRPTLFFISYCWRPSVTILYNHLSSSDIHPHFSGSLSPAHSLSHKQLPVHSPPL